MLFIFFIIKRTWLLYVSSLLIQMIYWKLYWHTILTEVWPKDANAGTWMIMGRAKFYFPLHNSHYIYFPLHLLCAVTGIMHICVLWINIHHLMLLQIFLLLMRILKTYSFILLFQWSNTWLNTWYSWSLLLLFRELCGASVIHGSAQETICRPRDLNYMQLTPVLVWGTAYFLNKFPHIGEIKQYLSFLDILQSANMIYLGSIYVVTSGRIFF